MTPLAGAILLALAALTVLAIIWIPRRARTAARRAVHQFGVRLDRYKLMSRRVIRGELLRDPAIGDALEQHCRTRGLSQLEARVRVEQYVEEIVPFFNVLTYYRVGYNLARALLRLLYRTSSEYQDRESLNAIPRRDVVVYLMNHRSNADYVVVAFVLARAVSISYAVGEWARVWPLEYVFKSFGAYFVRRRYREPLYHTVLERYVQLITRNGVTQGIFLEGRLSRDGALGPPKLGLLDYIARTLRDPAFDRDIWLVPVALNYDRVLEDRSLIQELLEDGARPPRWRQLAGVTRFLTLNLARLLTGNLRRYGRVAVNFGTPLSLRRWVAAHPDLLDLSRAERLPRLEGLARELMDRIAGIMPVTPVPLVAAALLSFGRDLVRLDDLFERLDQYRDHLMATAAKLAHADQGISGLLERARKTLDLRRLVVAEGEALVILPGQRPLLEYYANSIQHLLPAPRPSGGHPMLDPDTSLPRLPRAG
ncbi:MAG: 1-acyl-sn-glycerol-3-phosphate acyltransferase [Gemmatimonadetes bacterium]|nr:1-acyl-sn-glycerol-3-phosphate acyltransferase [Gemmatimonadota bacterium]